MSSIFFRVFQHLLPDALAWRIRQRRTTWYIGDEHTVGEPGLLIGGIPGGRAIDRLFDALTEPFISARTFIDLIFFDQFPRTTRQLPEWEQAFGLFGFGSADERVQQLEAEWQSTGGQSPSYIQTILQTAGFDVYVFDWWSSASPYIPRDPRDFTAAPLIGAMQAGESFAQAGEPEAVANAFVANDTGYLVNGDLIRATPPPVPDDPAYWRHFVYIGAEPFGVHAQVLVSRRSEFIRLVRKLVPAEKWVVLLIDYVTELEAETS